MRQFGLACLNFESSNGGLPRGGEHIFFGTPVGGMAAGSGYKLQDLQSPITLILPYIEAAGVSESYDLRYRYNETAQNRIASGQTTPIFFCPSNPLANDRVGGKKDSQGYGCCDYTTVPYIQLDAAGNSSSGYWLSSTTGKSYPDPNPLTPENEAYTLYAMGMPPPGVSASKMVQLSLGIPIDAMFGLPKLSEITDGTSNTILMYETCGQNERMGPPSSNAYYDPVEAAYSKQWRWANPDFSSGMSKKLNNNKFATYTTPDPNGDGCTWTTHDCGPNSEAFSFHGNGVHMVFSDGHAVYMRESVSLAVLRALATRDQARNEASLSDTDY
jgi:hypothetical protein